MTYSIVAISGSPSRNSTTAKLAEYALAHVLARSDSQGRHIHVIDLDPKALLRGDLSNAKLKEAVDATCNADGLIVATPIYKASYTGLLKAFLDILRQFALAGKAALPLATGGSPAHVLALDYGLRPVLHSMGVRHVVQSFFLVQSQFSVVDGKLAVEDDVASQLNNAIDHFRLSLSSEPSTRHLGHPRPSLDATRAA